MKRIYLIGFMVTLMVLTSPLLGHEQKDGVRSNDQGAFTALGVPCGPPSLAAVSYAQDKPAGHCTCRGRAGAIVSGCFSSKTKSACRSAKCLMQRISSRGEVVSETTGACLWIAY